MGLAKPLIITPVAPTSAAQANAVAHALGQNPDIDVIEWRVDALAPHHLDSATLTGTAPNLDGSDDDASLAITIWDELQVCAKPLICTWRTEDPARQPGGDYARIVRALLQLKPAYIDIEIAQPSATSLIAAARQSGVKVIASAHEFHPDGPRLAQATHWEDKLVRIAQYGQIAKLAVMLPDARCVSAFETAARKVAAACAAGALPAAHVLAIAMGQPGQRSRTHWVEWGNWGSFATSGYASAPGQVPAAKLAQLWRAQGWRE